MSEIIIGIDLGTTNSEVAVVNNDSVNIIGDGLHKIVPSFVGIGDDGGILVGESAKNQYALYPERTIKSIKRKMGDELKVQMAGQEYAPQEIASIILKHLKTLAEKSLGHSVSKAVITVPAYFNDSQRQATREAGEIAGLEVVRIINEPTAAALSFEADNKGKKHVLVYDLGGGTFDVSVVRMEDDIVEVVASHGNNHLGGDDFDERIIEFIVDELKDKQDIDIRNSPQAISRITRSAEQAKCHLSDHPYVKIEEEYLYEIDNRPIHLSLELSREDYEQMIQSYIDETLEAVHIALKSAEMTVSDIDQVLLVGGSTRTPLVRQRLEEEFQSQPRGELDPDLCVAMGAAIQAATISGVSVSSVLVDITPYTFGTNAIGDVDGMPTHDMYVPIIRKNTPIPVTKSEVFYTMMDNQQRVEVMIYQGENPRASNNLELGKFNIEGLSKAPAGNPVILRLALDLDGVLQVTATEKNTALEKSISIDNAMSRLDDNKLTAAKERIDTLFETSENAGENTGKEHATSHQHHQIVQALALVEKAERMLDQATPDDKEDLINLIEDTNDVIKEGNINALHAPIEALSDILYYLEP